MVYLLLICPLKDRSRVWNSLRCHTGTSTPHTFYTDPNDHIHPTFKHLPMLPLSLLHLLTHPVSTAFCSSPKPSSCFALLFNATSSSKELQHALSSQSNFQLNVPPAGPLFLTPWSFYHPTGFFILALPHLFHNQILPCSFSSTSFAFHIMYHIASNTYFITIPTVCQVLTVARHLAHITTFCPSSKG